MSLQPQEQERRSSASVLCQVLQLVADALNADAAFACGGKVRAFTEDAGDVDTEIEQSVSGLGLAVCVQFVSAKNGNETLGGPVFKEAQALVEISELPVTNRSDTGSGVTALEHAERVCRILHQRKLSNGRTSLVTDLSKFGQPPPPATVCYHVLIKFANLSVGRKDA